MKYLWIVFLIIAYIVTWIVFVIKIIDEINYCKCEYKEPSIADFIAEIFSNKYVKVFLITHAVVLFIISIGMYLAEVGE